MSERLILRFSIVGRLDKLNIKIMNENYNNSAEGNDMRKWIDKVKAEEKEYILIPIDKIEDLWMIANAGSEAEDSQASRSSSAGQARLIKYLYENYGKSTDEITQIITEQS